MKTKPLRVFLLLLAVVSLQSQVSKKSKQQELNEILGSSESKSIMDQVFNDDVIISFSLCVGQDCNNGESFGFDTQRFKENNLRIKFDDTSNSASFPNNDWEIEINESSNGGSNHFAIKDVTNSRTPFKIYSQAPNASLWIDHQGDVGIGEDNPVVELHLTDGDTPTYRLEQDGSAGFQAQTWDLAGNETNFFIRDVTNGSSLPFRVRPGAPTSSIDIKSNVVEIKNVALFDPSSPSDLRLKNNIVSLKDATGVLIQLEPKSFFYTSSAIKDFNFSNRKHFGLVAQEVQKVLPEVVKVLPIGEDDEEYLTVKYESFIPYLIQGFKEQQTLIEAQNQKIIGLEKQVSAYADLEARVNALEGAGKINSKNAKR
ncbi:tail fiber domain-containing protein [Jiulongibacter sp. NS-SX5]|uniref:tail fiber domain-containing protein n=1 Tax=Jiulongibacter sp. NS-SX5 TaxID=3463854 RepID=UPI0040590BB1